MQLDQNTKKKKILIVEDDRELYEMYKIKFESVGFEVKIAENGFEASVNIQEFNPDIILLDIMMPDMDGFETLKVIKQQTSIETKIIMFTNLDRKEDIDLAYKLGADDYLVKANVTPNEAVERIMKFISKDSKTIFCPHCGIEIDISSYITQKNI